MAQLCGKLNTGIQGKNSGRCAPVVQHWIFLFRQVRRAPLETLPRRLRHRVTATEGEIQFGFATFELRPQHVACSGVSFQLKC